jgi:hypothetical protein
MAGKFMKAIVPLKGSVPWVAASARRWAAIDRGRIRKVSGPGPGVALAEPEGPRDLQGSSV